MLPILHEINVVYHTQHTAKIVTIKSKILFDERKFCSRYKFDYDVSDVATVFEFTILHDVDSGSRNSQILICVKSFFDRPITMIKISFYFPLYEINSRRKALTSSVVLTFKFHVEPCQSLPYLITF